MTRTALRTALVWRDEVMQDIAVGPYERITLGSRCARRFPWLYAFLIVVVDGLLGAQFVLLPILPDWLSWSCLLAANLVVWFLLLSKWRASGLDTFVVPNLGLPPGFAVIRPGNRGYLLTLGERMRGTIYVGGQQQDVSDMVRRDGAVGGFCATPIGGYDWGLVDLDESGHYKLFFQFVQLDIPPPPISELELILGAIYTVFVFGVGMALWYLSGSIEYSIVLASSLEVLAVLFWAWNNESRAGLAFALTLHLAFLLLSFQLKGNESPFVWPGPRSLTGNYLVTRLDKEEPPEPKPTIGTPQQNQPAAAATKDPPRKTATKGDEGKSGGKGDTERARDPNARDAPPEPPKVQFFEDKNRKVLDNIIDRNLATSLSKFTGIKGDTLTRGSLGFGPGAGTGVGPGEGTGTRSGNKKAGSGGGGNVEGDFVTGPGKIDTGTNRPGGGTCKGAGCGSGPKPVQVAFAEPSGDFGGLTAEEIDRVIKARAGIFRACYQKELNHTPGIGGKLLIHFKIGGDGIVQAGSTTTASGSTLRNDAVEQCVKSNVNRLKFPAKGGLANVNYPFVFTQGG